MGRIPRTHVPGGIYHGILQGNNGETLFRCDEDRVYFCELLGEGVERFGHRFHAHGLMTNHVHLSVQVAEQPTHLIFHHCCLKYSKWFNKKYKRKGHLFQGPYKTILVETHSFLLTLIRYIHLNPVQAGIVERPEDYKWSSHRAYVGEEPPTWLSVDFVLRMFGENVGEARIRFQEFISGGINQKESPDFDRILSGQTRPIEVVDVIESVCRIYDLSKDDIRAPGTKRRPSEARALCAALTREFRDVTMMDMSQYFGRTIATLSESAIRLLDRAKKDPALEGKLKEAKRALMEKA